MILSFRAELRKAHRRHDLLLCLLLPLVMILWVGGLTTPEPDDLATGYSSLLFTLPIVHAMLLPVLMAVLTSRLWDMEFKGSMPKLLYTLQTRRSLFIGKIVFGLLEIAVLTGLEIVAALLLGKVHGYTETLPVMQFIYLTICTLAVETMLFFFSFLLILRFKNPLPSLCISVIGSLSGVFSAVMPRIVAYFVPWSYFIPLSAYEVADYNKTTHFITYGTRSFNWPLLSFTLALSIVFFTFSWRKVRNQEV